MAFKSETTAPQPDEQLLKDLRGLLTFRESYIKTHTVVEDMQIIRFNDLFIETKNSLWVWTAISYCLSPPEKRNEGRQFTHIIDDEYEKNGWPRSIETSDGEYEEGKIPDDPCVIQKIEEAIDTRMMNVWRAIYAGELQTLPIPEWCMEYLKKCALSIVGLATNEEISAKDAAIKIPEVLQLTRRGWNAFAEDRKDTARRGLKGKFDQLVYEEGLTKSAARKALLEEAGLGDERSLQRILARLEER